MDALVVHPTPDKLLAVDEALTRLAADGTAVVLSSHRMDDVAALCAEVTILNTGRVVFSGPVDKLGAESGELAYRLVWEAEGWPAWVGSVPVEGRDFRCDRERPHPTRRPIALPGDNLRGAAPPHRAFPGERVSISEPAGAPLA